MKSDAIAYGIAGILFGLIAGWVIGSQQAAARPSPAAAPQAAAAAPAAGAAPRAPVLDEAQVTALKSVAQREPKNAAPRTQLANLYFDAEKYDDAIAWYAAALKLTRVLSKTTRATRRGDARSDTLPTGPPARGGGSGRAGGRRPFRQE